MSRYPKRTLALGIVAALSITLNLLIIGSLIGEKAGRPRHMERGLVMQMIGSVPPEVRPMLRTQLFIVLGLVDAVPMIAVGIGLLLLFG